MGVQCDGQEHQELPAEAPPACRCNSARELMRWLHEVCHEEQQCLPSLLEDEGRECMVAARCQIQRAEWGLPRELLLARLRCEPDSMTATAVTPPATTCVSRHYRKRSSTSATTASLRGARVSRMLLDFRKTTRLASLSRLGGQNKRVGATLSTSPRPAKTAVVTAAASRPCSSNQTPTDLWWWTDTPRMATATRKSGSVTKIS